VNWAHVLGVAPALFYLKYRPDLVVYTPYVAAGVVAYHGWRIYQKSFAARDRLVKIQAKE